MAFTPFSGVNASFKAVKLAPDLTKDLVQSATVSAATTVAVGSFASFTRSKPREGGEVIAANCPADAQGNIYPRKLQGGMVKPKITVEATYDGDTSAGNIESRFPIGCFIKFDEIFHTAAGYGSLGNVGVVASVEVGAKVGKDPATFKMDIEYDGLPTAPSFAS